MSKKQFRQERQRKHRRRFHTPDGVCEDVLETFRKTVEDPASGDFFGIDAVEKIFPGAYRRHVQGR